MSKTKLETCIYIDTNNAYNNNHVTQKDVQIYF